jgi:radical SAM protein with 4Fe4S-binding SPASM domain
MPSYHKAAKIGAQLLFQGRYTLTFDQLDFHLNELPLSKRLNLLIQGAQVMVRSAHRIGFPPILQVEPTNTCNLNCLTCATGAKLLKRKPCLMPFEMFCRVIDQVKNYVYLLVLWSWGEPFLNKDALRMIQYAKDNGLIVHTSTNGHFFGTRKRARQVIESGLDSIVVAVDGLDQNTYEKYRRNGKLELVIKSIENLVAERASARVKNPLITFRFIVMKHNEHQVGKVKDFAENLGVDMVTFRSAVIDRGALNLEEDLTPHIETYQQFEYTGLPGRKHRIERNDFYCHRPYANLTIFSNGDVVSCENDYNAAVPLGNVQDQSLREIVSSARSISFLKAFRRDRDRFEFCRDCELRDIKHRTANVKTHVLNKEM